MLQTLALRLSRIAPVQALCLEMICQLCDTENPPVQLEVERVLVPLRAMTNGLMTTPSLETTPRPVSASQRL
jgi:hypothetical protein